MQRTMDAALELERAQLAVLIGNIIVDGFNITENMNKTIQPLFSHGTQQASVYVDHESDFSASRHPSWLKSRCGATASHGKTSTRPPPKLLAVFRGSDYAKWRLCQVGQETPRNDSCGQWVEFMCLRAFGLRIVWRFGQRESAGFHYLWRDWRMGRWRRG